MKKRDLKFGDIITSISGRKYIYGGHGRAINQNGMMVTDIEWARVREVDRYVQLISSTTYDIFINQYKLTTIYEKKILDEVEKEYLYNIVKPFKNKVEYIVKYQEGANEYISIAVQKDVSTFLPNFKKGTMYKGMRLNKKYTLKDLGMED